MSAVQSLRSAEAGAPPVGGEIRQHLIFSLSEESFAIPILGIKEIIEYGSLTQVPMMPAAIKGVINLRGAVVPVIDLAVRFRRAPTQVAKRTCIVIVEHEHDGARHDVGVIVDRVNEVLEIHPGEIEPAPAFGANIRAEFIAGMGKLDGRFVIMLDIDRVLALDELGDIALDRPAPEPLPA